MRRSDRLAALLGALPPALAAARRLIPRDPAARAQVISAGLHGAAFLLLALLAAAPAPPAAPETYVVRFRPEAAPESTAGKPKASRQTAKKETLRPEKTAARAATGRDPRVGGGRRVDLSNDAWTSAEGRRQAATPDLSRLLEVDDRLAPRPVAEAAPAAAADEPSPVGSGRALNEADLEVRGERRLVNLSAALDAADETGAAPRAARSGGGLEIGLLENSTYTLMPEFLWGVPEIVYPEWARRRGSEGEVLLVIDIRENGEVGMARAAETPLDPELADFVIKEASAWRFKPMYRDGRALSGTVSVRVRYVLDSGSAAAAVGASSSAL